MQIGRSCCAILLCLFSGISAFGNVSPYVRWNFNSTPPDGNQSTGTLAPSLGTGTIAALGGVSATFWGGSVRDTETPQANNSAWLITNFPPPGTGSGTAGFQVAASVVGKNHVALSWEHIYFAFAPRYARIDVAFDGGAWTTLETKYLNGVATTSGFPVYQSPYVPVPSGAATVSFRVVAVFEPGSTNYAINYQPIAQWNIDRVTVMGQVNTAPVIMPPPSELKSFFAGTAPFVDPSYLYFEEPDAFFGDTVTINSITGSPRITFNGSGFVYTPPAPAELNEPSFVDSITYTATDSYGLNSTGTVSFRVYNPSFCAVTITPGNPVVNCDEQATLTAGEPPGTGGQVTYRWGYARVTHDPGPIDFFTWYNTTPSITPFPQLSGSYFCVATRTGGTVGCGTTPQPVMSTFARVTRYSADVGQAGGIPGVDSFFANDDFVVFISLYFNGDLGVDFGSQGGNIGADGRLDNNDFVVFIELFFQQC